MKCTKRINGDTRIRSSFAKVILLSLVALMLLGAGQNPGQGDQRPAFTEDEAQVWDESLRSTCLLFADKVKTWRGAVIDRTEANPWMAKGSPVMKGAYLCFDDWIFDLFYFAPDYANQYAAALNKWDAVLGQNVEMHVILAPTACEFRMPQPYWSQRCAPQDQAIGYAYAKMNQGIDKVDGYSSIREHRDEYLFFRSDHHWTALGAYRGYEAVITAMGQTPIPLEQYPRIDGKQPFFGSFYSLAKLDKETAAVDSMWYYDVNSVPYTFFIYDKGKVTGKYATVFSPGVFSDNSRGNEYAVFLRGDHPYCKIVTKNKNGEKLLVVKDSYGNALIPFLIPHFEEIHVIDPRHYEEKVGPIVQKNGITDVLFIDYSMVLGIPSYSKKIADLVE